MGTLRSRLGYAAVVIAVFFVTVRLNDWLGRLDAFRGLRERSAEAAWVLVSALEVSLCLLALALAWRTGWREALRELGLLAPPRRALAFAFLATLPMLVAFAATSPLAPESPPLRLFFLAFFWPLAEEIVFRGYLFRQLFSRAGWGFGPAALFTAVFFGLGHLYQGAKGDLNLLETAGVVAITALGSVFFSWLFLRWGFNLWVPFWVHALMNLWWELFAVDETALGGGLANAARTLSMLLAIALTLLKGRIWRSERVDPLSLSRPSADLGSG